MTVEREIIGGVSDADDDEGIDFFEILASIAPFLIPAAIVGLLCGIAGFFYAMSLQKEYLATAKYTIKHNSESNMGTLGGFSGLLPRSGRTSEAGLAADKIMSRDFILPLLDSTRENDAPFFTGDEGKPGLIGTLLNLVLPPGPITPEQREERVVRNFRNSVSVQLNDNGVIEVQVSHHEPEYAAKIANAIVQTHIDKIEEKRKDADQRQVRLTTERMDNARMELDEALEKARIYAIENNMRSEEDLGVSSVGLNNFRRQRDQLENVLEGLSYLEDRQRNSPDRRVNIDAFFEAHPMAFAQLQQSLNWETDGDDFLLPTSTRLVNLRQALIDEQEQITRTLSVMEQEASSNAEAAGTLAELQRNIEVRKAVFTNLVTQSEARALGAALQSDEQVEWIQAATPPLTSSSPRVVMIALVWTMLGGMTVLLMRLLRVRQAGTLHTAGRIAHAFRSKPLASGIARSVGHRARTLSAYAQQSQQLSNAGLVDLILALREDRTGSVVVLGAPRTPVVYNLAAMLGSGLADAETRVAVIDLGKKKRGVIDSSIQSYGVMKTIQKTEQVSVLNWSVQDPAKNRDALPLDKALEQVDAEFDCIVIASAPLEQSLLRNRLALGRAERVLVLASKGRTRQHEVDWVHNLLSRIPNVPYDLVLS